MTEENANPFALGQLVRLQSGQGPTMTVFGRGTMEAEGQLPRPVVSVFWLDKEDRFQAATLPIEAVAALQ